GAAGLIDHHVLAVAHHLDSDVSPLTGYAGRDDQRHLGVLEQTNAICDARNAGKALDEASQRLWLALGPPADAGAAELEQAADLLIDVTVLEADGGELQGHLALVSEEAIFGETGEGRNSAKG